MIEKVMAHFELRNLTPGRFQSAIRAIVVAALVSGFVSPWFSAPIAQASQTPFISSNANAACALSIDNTNQNTNAVTVESRYQNGYCYLRFTTETTWTTLTNTMWLPTGVNSFDYLIVAGGGGGGKGSDSGYEAGGGGAGGLRYGTWSGTGSRLVTLQIGAGGATQQNGADSFISLGTETITVSGGGAGATSSGNGNSGGSGGGGSHNQTSAGTGNKGGYSPSEGNSGGKPTTTSRGGGGGGWASAGSDGYAGTGYVDTAYTYWPDHSTTAYYTLAYGGNGVLPGTNLARAGGVGGAMDGTARRAGGDAVADTGSGGGGSYSTSGENYGGGRGADGVIYIKYIPSQTDGLSLTCYADPGAGNFTKNTIDYGTSQTSDTLFPFPGDSYLNHNYDWYGPRECGTYVSSPSSWNLYTEYLYGYIKAPVSGTVYLIINGDDGVSIDIGDDTNVYRNVWDIRVDDGGSRKGPSAALTWTAGKWYKIGIWHHENGGGSRLQVRYNTSTNGATTASDTEFPRQNLSTLKGWNGSLSYTSLTGPAGASFSPNFNLNGSEDSDGVKVFSTSTPTVCSVNANTGVATTLTTGTCTILMVIPSTSTYAAQRRTASFRVAITTNGETDTAGNFNTNNAMARNVSGTLIPSIASGTSVTASSFTIEAWVRTTQYGGGTIFQQGPEVPDGTNAKNGLRLYTETNSINTSVKVAYTGFGINSLNCDKYLDTGKWTHIAIVITLDRSTTTNTKMQCFYDGVKVKEYTSTAPQLGFAQNATLGQGIYIGNKPNLMAGFSDLLDEVKVWNTARTQSQIQSDLKTAATLTDPDLLAYYDFNENTGDMLYNRKAGAGLDNTDLQFANWDNSYWNEVAITGTDRAYTYVKFTRTIITTTGGWKVPSNVSKARELIVGGGGGGGSNGGGGGGAGALLETTTYLTTGTYMPVVIGLGGLGYKNDYSPTTHAESGTSTIFDGKTLIGGGGGASNISGAYNGNSGGSGGGAVNSGTAGTSTTVSSQGYGLGFAGGASTSSTAGGGGGGAGGAGGAASGSTPGAGGAGYANSWSGVATCYATGGGGMGSGSTGGLGGSCTGISRNGNDGTDYYSYGLAQTANTGSGGGAVGTNGDSGKIAYGQSGSAGIVIIHWITKLKPTFTNPISVDTTTAGLAYKLVIGGSSDAPLARNYAWQWTNGTASTWVTYATSDTATLNFASPETMTSGPLYSYRVVITDSDTDGLSITDTSTSFYLVINPRITITTANNVYSFTQKYGESQTVVFTIANGTGTRTTTKATTTANTNGYLTWSNLNSDSATLTINTGAWAGTYSETLTVTDSVSATTTQVLSIVISKADTITVTTRMSFSSITYSGTAVTSATRTITGLKGSDTVTAFATSCRTGGACAVGDIAPGGGWVFYVSPTVIDVKTGISSGGIYLATAPQTQWTQDYVCNQNGTLSGYNSTASSIGTGASNTDALGACTSGGIKTTTDLSFTDNGITYSDWFVPSRDEMVEASKLLQNFGGMTKDASLVTYKYWTSSPTSSTNANYVDLTNGNYASTGANTNRYVIMPIRAFSPTTSYTVYAGLNCANGGACAIGDTAPGGGKVFYINPSDIDNSYGVSNGGKYLATAPASAIQQTTWCGQDITPLSLTSFVAGIGSGANNTALMQPSCLDTSAANYAGNLYDINGYEDWFLPSLNEINLIWANLIYTTKWTLPNAYYWTSSAYTSTNAYTMNLVTGVQNSAEIVNALYSVLPIRAFNPQYVNLYSPPSDANTYVATSSITLAGTASFSNYQAVQYSFATFTINKAPQTPMYVPQYGGTPSSIYSTNWFYIPVFGGSGPGSLHLSLVDTNTTDCVVVDNGPKMYRTGAGSCAISVTKAGSPNYLSSTLSANIYWYLYDAPSSVSSPGGPHPIPITDGNTFNTRSDSATVSAFKDTGGNTITSARIGSTVRILVSGWSGLSPTDITVYFNPYEDAVVNAVTSTYVEVVVPATATTGTISVDGGPKGMVVTPSLTVTP